MDVTYQVGNLLALDPADPELSCLQKAIDMARRESEINDKTPYGVWTGQEHGSDLLVIAYQGFLYRSEL